MSFVKINKDMYVRAEEVCAIEIVSDKACKLYVEDVAYDCNMSAENAKRILEMENGGMKTILKQIRDNQTKFVG